MPETQNPYEAYAAWYEQSLAKTASEQGRTLLEQLSHSLTKTAAEIYNAIDDASDAILVPLTDGILEIFKTQGMITDDTDAAFKSLIQLPPPLDLAAVLLMFVSLLQETVKINTSAASSELQRNLFSKYTPNIADEQSLLKAGFVAPEKIQEIREKLRQHGYGDEDIDLMILARYQLYDVQTIRVAFFRGALSKEQVYERMRELGYTDTRIQEIMSTWDVIPNVQDLLYMVAKEAFEPEMYQKLGLDDEFPEEQVQWMQKQGLSRDWTLKYWYAHWDQPSIGQGFEMLHRRVIDEKTLDLLFRATEIPPFWRDKLTQIAYRPLTRVDVRRMHDLGTLDTDGVYDAYLDHGYSPENAQKMTEFTLAYNAEHDRDLTRSQVEYAYANNRMERDLARQHLQEMDYSWNEAEFILEGIDFEQAKEREEKQVARIRKRYVENVWAKRKTEQALYDLGLATVAVQNYLEDWGWDKQDDITLPSKTDLFKFYQQEIIQDYQLREYLFKLGYTREVVDWYTQLAGIQAEET